MSVRGRNRAFSIVDLLIVTAITGALCAVALPSLSGARNDVIDARLQSDVDTINYAIGVFRSKGGCLDGLTDPNAILAQLKNHQEEEESSELVQFLGSADQMINPRLTARIQVEDEEPRNRARAVWDSENQQFVLEPAGRGVSEFYLARDQALE